MEKLWKSRGDSTVSQRDSLGGLALRTLPFGYPVNQHSFTGSTVSALRGSLTRRSSALLFADQAKVNQEEFLEKYRRTGEASKRKGKAGQDPMCLSWLEIYPSGSGFVHLLFPVSAILTVLTDHLPVGSPKPQLNRHRNKTKQNNEQKLKEEFLIPKRGTT